MASTFTTNLGVEKPAKGDYANNWQSPANNNYDLLDRAISGSTSIVLASAGTSGAPNTLPVTDGTLSNGQFAYIEFTDGADLGATAFVQLTPNDAQRIITIRNGLSAFRSLIVFQGTYNASNDLEIGPGDTVVVKFDGAGASATAVAVGGSELFNSVTIRHDVTNPALSFFASDASTHSISANPTDGLRLNAATGAYGVAVYTGGGLSFKVDQSGNTDVVDGVMKITTEEGNNVNLLTLNNNNTGPVSSSPKSQLSFEIGGVEYGSVGYTENALGGMTIDNSSGSSMALRGNDIAFSTNSTEKMRLHGSGEVTIGTQNPLGAFTVESTSVGAFYTRTSLANFPCLVVYSDNVQTQRLQFRVTTEGNVENRNNSYGALSDERMKSDIKDAPSQIDDLMAVKVRKYKMNGSDDEHLGVIAQELEAAGMGGLVATSSEPLDGIDNPKSVKYSVLYMKAIKAIQEQQTLIETLTARITQLENQS